jgi:hypothetical protein
MMKILFAAAFLASSGVAYGQTPTSPQHENPAPQSTTRSPAATLPETKTVAPDATGAPVDQTGKAPNVSKETLINAAMRLFAAQGNVFSCQSRQLTTAGGSGWPWCRQADASVLRARYRFASANSENTWAPFLAMPR